MRLATRGLLAITPILAILAIGCGGDPVCREMALPSISIIVTHEGKLFRPDAVTFTVNGGPLEQARCVPCPSNPGPQNYPECMVPPTPTGELPCLRWRTDFETPGSFAITVLGCGTQASRTVEVQMGECNVEAQQVEIALGGSC